MTVVHNGTSEGVLYAVYGSLRKGGSNHRHLEGKDVELVGHFITEPKYEMLSVQDRFPALLTDGNTSITLELYTVNSEVVEDALDRLEGYNPNASDPRHNMYDKDIIDTPYGPAFIYFWNDHDSSHLNPVDSGDWIDYLKIKNSQT